MTTASPARPRHRARRWFAAFVLGFAVLLVAFAPTPPGEGARAVAKERLADTSDQSGTAPTVSIVADVRAGSPAGHGLNKLVQALRDRGVTVDRADALERARGSVIVVAGTANARSTVTTLLRDGRQPLPEGPEALVVRQLRWREKPVWVLAGSDERGLMYAELDVAARVGWSTAPASPFVEVRETAEKPDVHERALSIYTFNRAYWESRFYDERYWAKYLDVLAENRFNSLVVIFGYENGGFLAPCYPYFFDLPEFPDVRMVGITPAEQQRNVAALNRVIQMAHERGLAFTVGIWDHIYRGGVQGGGIPGADVATTKPVPGLVWGVTADNLVPYTKAALARFVQAVPALDAVQFRMHDESGLKVGEQEAFWRDVFAMMKAKAPRLRLDLRAKGLPDSVIQSAIDAGVPFRVTTKYWMEQMGLPFHPTHINTENQFDRRHSYADLLRYPQRYRMHWRLWNGGTARVLLWGDPDYVRRFAASTHLYDGDGFEVNEPLCTKMLAQPHDAKPFDLLAPPHRYYEYEFERYWHFFQVFGRLGYDPQTPPDVWRHEFERRFGTDVAPIVERALHEASWILPRIVATCYPYSAFPMTRGWAEKQRLGDLPAYARAEGSDIAQFASFDEEARLMMEGGETAKMRPAENARWFDERAASVRGLVAEAERRSGARRNAEFESTVTDLKILAGLALFHARRTPAAVNYRLFERTKDPAALDEAIAAERESVGAWRQIVRDAGEFYAADLMMGVRGATLSGHWRDELAALERGLAALERQRGGLPAAKATSPAPRYSPGAVRGTGGAASVVLRPVVGAVAGSPLTIAADVRDPAGVTWVRLRYRSLNQQRDYRTTPMVPAGGNGRYEATIPAEDVPPEWDLMYFVEVMNAKGVGRIYPDLERETPYVVVKLRR